MTETETTTELAYTFKGGKPFPWGKSVEALRSYIARAEEYGNNPADFAIVTREVTVTRTQWTVVR